MSSTTGQTQATTTFPLTRYGHRSSLDLLNCALCAGRYKTPKVLPCLHTFCQNCLSSAIPAHSLSVTCPVCRQQSILPEEGVRALQTNVFVQNINHLLLTALSSPCHCCGEVQSRPTFKCLDCLKILCDNCRINHITMSVANNNDIVDGSSHNNIINDSDTFLLQNNNHNNAHAHEDDNTSYDGDISRTNNTTNTTTEGISDCNMLDDTNSEDLLDDQQENDSNDDAIPPHNVVSIDELISSMSLVDSISKFNDIPDDSTNNHEDTTVGSDIPSVCSEGVVVSSSLVNNAAAAGGGGGGGNGTLLCPSHSGNDLKYYCSHCETAVCETCTQTEHIGHLTVVLSEAIIEHKSFMTLMVSKVKQMIPQVVKALEVVEETRKSLASKTAETGEKITASYDELIQLIENRKQALLSDLTEVSKSKEEVLYSQKKALKSHLLRMTDSCELTQDSLARGKDTDVVMMKKEMAGKLNDLVTSGPTLQPETNDILAFDHRGVDLVRKTISNFGKLHNNTAVPYFTSAGGEAFSHCICGKVASVTVTTRDKNESLVSCGFVPFVASISTDTTEDRITPEVTDQENGTYDLLFTLPIPGVYYLSILMFGQHIKGSPYKLRAFEYTEANGGSTRMPRTMAVKPRGVKRPSSSRSQGSGNRRTTNRIEDDLIMRIGVKGRNRGEFFNPQGLCFCNDRVVVADSNNQNIQVFAPSGECKLRFGSPGRMPGKVQRPTGIAMSNNGNFLVADYDNKWVGVFDDHGKYINRIGMGKLLGPKGITVDREGRIIVVDNKSSSILIFQANGKFLHKFGSRGNNEDQFAGPHYVAVGKDNSIIISDFHNHCVKVFDSNGRFKFTFGSNGEGNGQFNAPTGVAVDERGNVLVADWGNSRIQVFDSHGSFLSYINTASEPLYGPQGLAVTAQGVAVVADSGNHCIKYYKYLQ